MIRLAAAFALIAGPAAAQQDFSEGSEAREWGLFGESKARFAATVVDPLCELAGQCDLPCAGDRQVALVREADGVMVLPLKNGQPAFTGAAVELAPYCGQRVEVDGLLIEDEFVGAVNVYLVQRILPEGADEWVRANRWTEEWAEAHPEAAGEGPWFRRDPRIAAEIAEEGWLGLGAEADAAFIADEYGE